MALWGLIPLLSWPAMAAGGAGVEALIRYMTGEGDLAQLELDLAKARKVSEGVASDRMAAEAQGEAISARGFGGMQEALITGYERGANPEAVLSRQRAASARLGTDSKGAAPMGSMVEALAQKVGLTDADLQKLPTAQEFSPIRAVMGIV